MSRRSRMRADRRRGHWPLGAMAGAVCGYFTYWAGATLVGWADLSAKTGPEIPGQLLRPLRVFTAWEVVLVLLGALIGASVARYRWRSAGLLSYVSLLSLVSGYVVYTLTVSIPQVPAHERWISYVLLTAETGGLGLILIFSFYSLDAATRRRWARVPREAEYDPQMQPKVALMVPMFNEPFELVEQTVAHLVRQDYPRDRFRVMVLDDSVDDLARWRLATLCANLGAEYITRPDRRGYKAGAINHATRLLPPDVELIAIIDADYWVQPDYVRSIVGYFANPRISFVQTPQDYRNGEESFLTRQYKRAEAYFYHAIMPSRNEQNAIIFCGTMGMIRRTALEEVGGFAEDQICEDAEISVRFAAHGWDSLYVDQSFGHGLMPAVFDAYKKQFHRWAFGNVKILFTRTGLILRSKMTRRQKFDYLVTNLHWFDGFFVMAIALVLLYLGLGPFLGYDAVTHHQREMALVALVPLALLVDGATRLHLVLRKAARLRFRDSLLVQGMWFSIKFTNTRAVFKSMLGFRTPFVRTPKLTGGRMGRFRSFFRAIRLTKVETLIGASLVAVGAMNARRAELTLAHPGAFLLPGWLTLYGVFFLCAPIYAYLSYRTLTTLRYRGVPVPGAPSLSHRLARPA